MFALEGYRAGELSRGQMSELLGLEFNETEGFLKEHKAYIPLTMEEFERSSEGLERLLSQSDDDRFGYVTDQLFDPDRGYRRPGTAACRDIGHRTALRWFDAGEPA